MRGRAKSATTYKFARRVSTEPSKRSAWQRGDLNTRLAESKRCIERALVQVRLGGLCPCRPGCSLLLSQLEVVVLQQNLVDHPKHARADGDGTDGPPE